MNIDMDVYMDDDVDMDMDMEVNKDMEVEMDMDIDLDMDMEVDKDMEMDIEIIELGNGLMYWLVKYPRNAKIRVPKFLPSPFLRSCRNFTFLRS